MVLRNDRIRPLSCIRSLKSSAYHPRYAQESNVLQCMHGVRKNGAPDRYENVFIHTGHVHVMRDSEGPTASHQQHRKRAHGEVLCACIEYNICYMMYVVQNIHIFVYTSVFLYQFYSRFHARTSYRAITQHRGVVTRPKQFPWSYRLWSLAQNICHRSGFAELGYWRSNPSYAIV